MKIVITIKEVELLASGCDGLCKDCKNKEACEIITDIVDNVPAPIVWDKRMCKFIVNRIKEKCNAS